MNVIDKYYRWLCSRICDRNHPYSSYSELLNVLFEVPFTYTIEMDRNRDFDGRELRYLFADSNYIPSLEITVSFSDKPCSILEMMVALSIRCEDQIMYDPDIGNRTGDWFWDMIENMGLIYQTNKTFEPNVVFKHIDRFLQRRYKANGDGGLFKLKNPKEDMRKVEIWYQLMWYLEELFDERRYE